jgi:FKBP-type peptidyl-prolyl cis-trans isomerase
MKMSSPATRLALATCALATCITLGSACTPPVASPPLAEPQQPARQATAPALAIEGTKEPTPSTPCKETADLTKLPGDPVTGEWVTTPSCLKYTLLRAGNGSQPKSRLSTVRAHYTGWLTDGTQFDSSVARGKPFDFRLSQVVPGWTEALLGMKAGEKRKLVIPYKLAYGREGQGTIPPKATLVFDVELLDVLVE